MMLSAIPSLRYSALGSWVMLVNGRTASVLSGFERKAKYNIPATSSTTRPLIANIGRRFRLMPATTYSALETPTVVPEIGSAAADAIGSAAGRCAWVGPAAAETGRAEGGASGCSPGVRDKVESRRSRFRSARISAADW